MLAAVARSLGLERVPGAVRLVVLLCLASAAIGTGLGMTLNPYASQTMSTLTGFGVGVAGVLLMVTKGDQGTNYRRWFGLLMLIYALGTPFDVFAGSMPAGVAAVGNAATALGMSAAFVLGVARLPSVPQPYKSSRSILEALLVGFASGGFIYRVTLENATTDPLLGLMQQAFLIMILSVFSLAVIAISLDRGPGMFVAVVGTCLIAAGESIFLVTGTDFPLGAWPGRVISSVGWALAVVGTFQLPGRLHPHPDMSAPRTESRNLTIVGTMIVVSAGSFLATFSFDPVMQPYTWAFAGIYLILLWVREVIRARQSQDLLQWLEEQVLRDPLTGAGNRRALEKVIERFSDNGAERMSFLTVDLDGFKDVNDQLGHSTGDVLLLAVSDSLTRVAHSYGAQFFRVGGDEFAVIAPIPPARTEEMAGQMVCAVADCGRGVPGVGRVSTGASIGVRHLHVAGGFTAAQAHAALGESGHAMRAAKVGGRGRVVAFDRSFAEQHRRRRLVETRLADPSIPRPQVHYQPVVSLVTGHPVGVEALARWQDPVLGVVEPSEFVSIAENRGLIHALGDHILNQALDDARSSGLTEQGLTMSVNVSILQLRVPGYTELVVEALKRSGVPPSLLVLEVTETIFVRPDDPALKTISELGELGIGFSLDDFGSGYSSLSHLSRLPVRTLKIDKSITERLAETKTRAIVRSVVEMANGLGLMVVLEGVETEWQVEQARALGVGYAQGWYFRAALLPQMLGEILPDSRTRGTTNRNG